MFRDRPKLAASRVILAATLVTACFALCRLGILPSTRAASNDATRHWSYVKPTRPPLPEVERISWPKNPIDRFVLAKLEEHDLAPSEEVDKATLIRRVTLDLTGLPPTLGEVQAFERDNDPQAYERVVDRLLASPHYGERMARLWLDLARYADSNGYQTDFPRQMWMYRDWVIEALNRDMPFDRFSIEQIAGDLLASPSDAQRIATGFNRNSMFNDEDGADEPESRALAVIDRVNTTMQTWMGTTFACAQCHDHKNDPFTQKEYYAFYAFFNSTTDKGAGKKRDMSPRLQYPSEEQAQRLETLRKVVDDLRAEFDRLKPLDGAAGYSEEFKKTKIQLEAKEKEEAKLLEVVPSTLVMEERDEPRVTHILLRGDFRRPGQEVEPGVPAVLHPFPSDQPRNRLGLARWICDPDNPLVGRVTMNRLWALLFGRGLVGTSDDFGLVGERPSHPLLLDWLATEFVEGGWDLKHMIRLMATSATYRQRSETTPDLLKTDPNNRWMARAPRFRLEAEAIRDNALAISGLLDPTIGGPSVFPFQPEGVWNALTVKGLESDVWKTSQGSDVYRRGLYTYWRRAIPYPLFSLFDAPNRKASTGNRIRTNTPLQALAALNEEAFARASIALALRMLTEPEDRSAHDRLVYGFRLCVARRPSDNELKRLDALLRTMSDRFASADPEKVKASLRSNPVPIPPALEPGQVAAWAVVANVLLNLDETLTKG